jgi:hypothetical protein
MFNKRSLWPLKIVSVNNSEQCNRFKNTQTKTHSNKKKSIIDSD